MTFKTNLPPASCPALSGFGVLAVDGRDAGAFLQAQVMNDVLALAPGQWQWNGWLTPKGRVTALFALLRASDDGFLLVLPDFPAQDLLPLLQRFVFRSKLKLEARSDLVVAAGPVLDFPDRYLAEGGTAWGWALDVGGPSLPRTLYLLPASSDALAEARRDADDAWFDADLAMGIARLPVDQRDAWTPQMLSLDRLDAFSLKKGCYPGQEIVARTHYLGQAKRELARLSGIALAAGQSVASDGKPVGTVVSATPDGRHGLAVLAMGAALPLSVEGRETPRLDLIPWQARSG